MRLRQAPSARRDRACLGAALVRAGRVRLAGHAGYRCGMTGPHATEARRLDLSDPDTLRRLRDLQADRPDPRLMMPPSRKGGKRARAKLKPHYPVPIPVNLAHRLSAIADGRDPNGRC